MSVKERESERSHLSLAWTPPAMHHPINRNWNRHTYSSPHSLQWEWGGEENGAEGRWGSTGSHHSLRGSLKYISFSVKGSDSDSWRALRHFPTLFYHFLSCASCIVWCNAEHKHLTHHFVRRRSGFTIHYVIVIQWVLIIRLADHIDFLLYISCEYILMRFRALSKPNGIKHMGTHMHTLST